jgi:hypothetical protein
VALFVLGSLRPYADQDQARKVMIADKVDDMLRRLRVIREHLVSQGQLRAGG